MLSRGVIGSASQGAQRRAPQGAFPHSTGSHATQGESPSSARGPAPSAGSPTPASGRDGAAAAQLLRACGAARGRTRREGAGCGRDNAASRAGGCGRKGTRMPSAPHRWGRRLSQPFVGSGDTASVAGASSQPRRGLAGRVTPRKLPWFSAPARRVNKHPAFNCCHAQTCPTAPGLRCHLPPVSPAPAPGISTPRRAAGTDLLGAV